jgi:hypothetical protein
MQAGPFLKRSNKKVLYALEADELTMFVPRSKLSDEDKNIDLDYVREMSLFGLSIFASTDPQDGLILNSEYKKYLPWIDWLRTIYTSLGLSPTDRIYFSNPGSFYEEAKNILKDSNSYDIVSSTSFSYDLSSHFDIGSYLPISQVLNRKTELVRLSKLYGFSIPFSQEINSLEELTSFPADKYPIYIKQDGLGGGVKVFKLASPTDIQQLRVPNEKSISQAAVPDTSVEVTTTFLSQYPVPVKMNHRIALVDSGYTYGSIYHPDFKLDMEQEDNLAAVSQGVAKEGYISDNPLIVGFDSFLVGRDIEIIEINARWLASTPQNLMLSKLRVLGNGIFTPITDKVAEDEIITFMHFCEENPYPNNGSAFSIIPVSFSAYMEADNSRMYSYIVGGSLHSFCKAIRERFSGRTLPLTPKVVNIYEDNCKKLNLKTYF